MSTFQRSAFAPQESRERAYFRSMYANACDRLKTACLQSGWKKVRIRQVQRTRSSSVQDQHSSLPSLHHPKRAPSQRPPSPYAPFHFNIIIAIMSLVDSAPPPLSPSTLDISRPKLKQLARWIRDDLDILVAREGPDVLRPDDLLTLHDLFLTLRRSTTITALDLCATGIHKAVKDIAGIATRWPRRLCDDCDTIITIWQSRFGPLEELHPFLYGRCGRLKGLASASEYGREVSLE